MRFAFLLCFLNYHQDEEERIQEVTNYTEEELARKE